MKNYKERMMGLDIAQKRVADRLMDEIVVGSCVIGEYVLKNNKEDVSDSEVYSTIKERVDSSVALLTGLLKYEDTDQLWLEVFKITK